MTPAPTTQKRWRARQAKERAAREAVRLMNAPVPENERTRLLDDIRALVAIWQLPQSDADWFFKMMQRNRWKWQKVPVNDWRWQMEVFFASRYFPSQR